MAESRLESEWLQASWVIASILNANRAKGPPIQPADVNPLILAKRAKAPPVVEAVEDISILAAAFGCKRK